MKQLTIALLSLFLLIGCGTEKNSMGSQSPSSLPSEGSNQETASSSQKKPDTVTVFSVNDIHGSLERDRNEKELGISRLSYAIKHDKDYDSETSIILSSGDSWQGGYLAYEDKSLTDALLGKRGVTARAIGNHEFDWGVDEIEALSKVSPYPYLGVNILDSEGNNPSFIKKSTIVEKGGVKYGIIGAIDPTLTSSIKAGARGGYSFSSDRNLIRSERNTLYEEGCDLVLLSAHADRKSEYILSVGNTFASSQLNGIFGGHSHQFQNDKVGSHSLPYIQAGSNSKGYGKRTFSLKEKKVTDRQYVEPKEYLTLSKDLLETGIEELLEKADKDHPTSTLATFKDTFYRYKKLNSFVPSARLAYGKEEGISKEKSGRKALAIHNLAGIRSNIYKGPVSEKELFKFSPFDNLVLVSENVSGKDIRNCIGSDVGNHATKYYCYLVEGGGSVKQDENYDVISIDFVFTSDYWKSKNSYKNIKEDGSPIFIRDRYKEYFLSLGSNPTISQDDYQ